MTLPSVVRSQDGTATGDAIRALAGRVAALEKTQIWLRPYSDTSDLASVPPSLTQVLTSPLTVPAGSSALVCVDATYTGSGTGTLLELLVDVNGIAAPTTASSSAAIVRQLFFTTITGLAPGDAISVNLSGTGTGWANATAAHTSTVIYFR